MNQRIDGTITSHDGTKTSFAITPDGYQQWGGTTAQLGETVELVGLLLDTVHTTDFFDAQPEPEEPRGITLTREQLEAWACRTLTDDEVDELDEAIPNSSIPDAIGTISDNL